MYRHRRSPDCQALRRCSITASPHRSEHRSRSSRGLNTELVKILSTDEMKKRLLQEGSVPTPGPPEAYATNMQREEGKWAALVKKLGLKFE